MEFTDYKNKRVVVTGASSGIGEAVARALVSYGAEVHALGRRSPTSRVASFNSLDLGDPESIETAVLAVGGHIDSLFNCAGAVPMAPSSEILAVNFLGTRLLTEYIVELMGTGGAIVSVSSDGGYYWRARLPLVLEFLAQRSFKDGADWYARNETAVGHAYSFGKEALDVWTLQQSAVLIKRGIRINTTSPGAVQTPMLEAIEAAYTADSITPTEQPIGRRSTAQEQVGPLLFLNSDSASYINGTDLAVDGGYGASISLTGAPWNPTGAPWS